MKTVIKSIVLLIISMIISLFSTNNITNNVEIIVPLIYTLLGLCVTFYIFLCPFIHEKIKGNQKIIDLTKIYIDEITNNMKYIFVFSILIIAINIIYTMNIPYILDPKMDFGTFVIPSVKQYINAFLTTYFFAISICTFYDIVNSNFIVVNGILFDNNKNK